MLVSPLSGANKNKLIMAGTGGSIILCNSDSREVEGQTVLQVRPFLLLHHRQMTTSR